MRCSQAGRARLTGFCANQGRLDGATLILLKNNKATILDAQDQELAIINFNEADQTWYSTIEGNTQKLMTISDHQVQLYTATGKTVTVDKANLHSQQTIEMYQELVALK